MNIGIDKDKNLVYEGGGYWGRALWPSPVLSPAKFTFISEGALDAEGVRELGGDAWIFREDSYDPTTRIRRGRFYKAGEAKLVEWHVQVHPAIPGESREAPEGTLAKYLDTFYGNPIWYSLLKDRTEKPLVLLGVEDRLTVWTIINIEAISTGEDLVTLKARSGLGVLPQVDTKNIPEAYRAAVLESLDGFADDVHRSAPVSVIHRARDAASHLLLAYYKATPDDARDLAKLTARLEKEEKIIASSAAKIIARLHARAKPVEKVRRPMRAVREQDAELATQCVGTILCELGWADWP